MANGKFSGAEKAAIFLMNLGEDVASEVARHLSPQEMQSIGGIIAGRDSVSQEDGKFVVNEFITQMGSAGMSIEGLSFAKNFMTRAIGAEKAQNILEQITIDMGGGGMDSIRWMDPAVVANTVKGEHPQIIALLLIHMPPERAGQVLLNLPDERTRGEVMLRVATLTRIPEAAVKDLEKMLSRQISGAKGGGGDMVEGVKVAAEILNQIESTYEEGIMGIIEKASPDLANSIQEKMFVFMDLLSLDDKGMQLIIKELTTEILLVALKGVDEEMASKFYDNMSERAAEMLREDIEAKGPVRLSDVEKGQQEIVAVARRLEKEGKVMREGSGGDELVV
jgi:flagellar motor switch protein FliG